MIKKRLLHKFYSQDAILLSFIKGSLWTVYGNVVVKGFSFVASIFVARMLTSNTFGELTIIRTTLSLFSLFATFGLGITITKFVSQKKRNNINDTGKVIAAGKLIITFLGIVLGLSIIIFSPFICNEILKSSDLILPLQISGVYLFFNGLTVYQVGVITGLEGFKPLAKINFITQF